MRFGYFNNQDKEYIITNPKTPVKWINYIGGLSFGGFIDQTGGSLICKNDPAMNRIVKYIPQLPQSSFNGETLYIRIKENNHYKVFSPFFTPTLDQYESYKCHVGLGYSKYVSVFYGIETTVTVFVPLNDHREIRVITVKNKRQDEVQLDIIPVVEYTHFEAMKQFNNADWVPQTMTSEAIKDDYNTILLQYAYMRKNKDVNFFTSNYTISSFETDRRYFLGENEYGTFQNPFRLKQEELSNYEAKRGDNIGALMHHLKPLKPNEEQTIITQLGQTDNIKDELSKIEYYRTIDNVMKELEQLKSHYQELFSVLQIDTPSTGMNSMINIFNPRQCNTTLNWSRYLSLYQLGLGARGIGFRDSSQDVMGVVSQSSEASKKLLIKLLSVQKRNGSAMHQFNPITMIANEGDSREEEDRDDFYGDDHLWIVLAVCSYLKETGDMDLLNTMVPFYEKDKNEKPIETDTVMEHLKRSLLFTKNNTGQNGLPLLGFADWNDTVNLPKGSESIFNANLYGVALLEMIELLDYLGLEKFGNEYRKDYQHMKSIVNDVCWDDEWYIRYIDHQNNRVGSKDNQEGKIYTNAQSWTIHSGFATENRAKKALEAIDKYLNTSKGIKLSYPSYESYDREKGGVTTYPKGAKENGGIFLHSNPWVMIAATKCGYGDKAFEYYNQINPATKNDSIEEFECEPYVYPQNILGNEHPQFGLARNSWLSGTASWTYQAATKYILGILPTYQGLKIDPCIPKTWDKFHVKRTFRNATYNITIYNPNNIEKGVHKMIVDDITLETNIIPIFNDNKEHNISVYMG
jgi:cellobiose phosphorylase